MNISKLIKKAKEQGIEVVKVEGEKVFYKYSKVLHIRPIEEFEKLLKRQL